MRLIHLAETRWESLDGYAVAHNMPDLRDLRIERFCNYVWWSVTRNADDKAIAKFRASLWRPPKGEAPDPRSPWSAENEAKGFAALRSALGGGAPASG